MRPWLAILSFSVISIILFVFFYLRLQPPTAYKNTNETIVPGSILKPTVTFINPSKGTSDAKVTIVEYLDFQCPSCKDLNEELEKVRLDYPNQVRIVWKNLPNESTHSFATPAAVAAHCAGEQGKFWEYANAVFAEQTILDEASFARFAQEMNLNAVTFESCYDNRDTLPLVKRDYEEAIGLGLTATPTFFINDEKFVGLIYATELKSYVEQALRE